MKHYVRIIPKILLLFYIGAVIFSCFAKLGPDLDFSSEWFGLPKDKVVHFLLFLPYPILAFIAFYKPSGKPYRFVMFLCLVLVSGALAGGGIELIQGLTDYRSCDIMDFRADCIGLAAGAFTVLVYGCISRRW